MKLSKSAGGVVFNKEGKVAVVDQVGSWSLPKGHIENGEDKLTTAKREIYEETGLKSLKLIKEFTSYKRNAIDKPDELKTIYMFLFTTKEKNLKPVDTNHPEARWVEVQKVAEHLTHKKDKEFFKSIEKEVIKFIKENLL